VRILLLLIFLFAIQFAAHSSTIEVPKDVATIQGAINVAKTYDVVLVAPGTYVENIDFKGKKITVKSAQGSSVTIIDGNQTGTVVTFVSGEGSGSILEGFTITNGNGELVHFPTIDHRFGGGIFCKGFVSPTITNNIISGNSVDFMGGGIHCENYAYPTIIETTISGNIARCSGGGISCLENASPTIDRCEISGNITPDKFSGEGGGVYCYDSSPILKNSIISKNAAYDSGGGIHCYLYSSPTLINNTISENTASYGGGIYCWKSSSPIISHNTISENSAAATHNGMGGGIYCNDNSEPTITNNYILNNTASGIWMNCGAGIFYGDVSSLIITNNTIWRNKILNGSEGYGGGICFWETASYIKIINNTIVENSVNSKIGHGGGICFNYDATSIINNSIIRDNKAPHQGPEMWVGGVVSSPSTVDISHSLLDLGQPKIYITNVSTLNVGAGMINTDPLFVDPAIGDLHLTYQSQCKDRGYNSVVTELTDIEGDPRIANGSVDIGADEFYTHLYYTGDATPGGAVELKFIDAPTTNPVIFWIGSGVLDPPIHTFRFGNFYLKHPLLVQLSLGSIPPPSGVLSLSYNIGPNFPTMNIPLQALIGKSLSNLCVMQVK